MLQLLHDYTFLKYVHIMSSTFLWGTGIGTFFFMVMAHLSGDVDAIRVTARHVVLADWLFTAPTFFIQPVSGILLMKVMGLPFDSTWSKVVAGLYLVIGASWFPVVWIQVRLRNLTQGLHAGDTLPAYYHRLFRLWVALGFPAGISMSIVFVLMVYKPWLS